MALNKAHFLATIKLLLEYFKGTHAQYLKHACSISTAYKLSAPACWPATMPPVGRLPG